MFFLRPHNGFTVLLHVWLLLLLLLLLYFWGQLSLQLSDKMRTERLYECLVATKTVAIIVTFATGQVMRLGHLFVCWLCKS